MAAVEMDAAVMRVGFGYDLHRLVRGRPLRLAGVEVPHSHGAVGDSDADVVLHAVIDAMLGAMAWGDIGMWFPKSKVAPGQDSAVLVQQVMTRMTSVGARVTHLDVTILAEAPRLAPWRTAMAARLAELVRPDSVNVKFKTHDQVGDVGAGQAVAAWAVLMAAVPAGAAAVLPD